MLISPPTDRRANLPHPRSLLVGRERETAAIRALLAGREVSLLTLTGPGGIGKTRLALHVAAELATAFAHGAVFVPLAPIRDPALVAGTIAQGLGIRDDGTRPIAEALADALRGEERLLVLDNFEQVTAAAPLVAALLTAAPRLTVLVTSRTPLHLSGEQEYPVPPLTLPDGGTGGFGPDGETSSVDRVRRSGAGRLFVERARACNPDFALRDEDAPAVAGICARLDGLPLAIELAAARSKVLPPKALLTRLDRRLPLLTGGPRDLPARLQTMRSASAWSDDLLSPDERVFFHRLAVFVGGFTLEAAESVVGRGAWGVDDEPPPTTHHPSLTLDLLAALIDASLLRRSAEGEAPRFAMLETIREYAEEMLAAHGDEDVIRRRHAAWCVELAERAEPELLGGRQIAWLDLLEAEHDNFRAALTWALARGETETGLRLTGALLRLWRWHGHLGEGRHWLEAVLAGTAPVPSRARAKALVALGMFSSMEQDYARATSLLVEALDIYRDHGDRDGIPRALFHLGEAALGQGDRQRARTLLEETIAAAPHGTERAYACLALKTLGYIARLDGDVSRATTCLEDALVVSQEIGFAFGRAESLTYLGEAVRDQGDDARAASLLAQGMTAYQELGDRVGIALCLTGLASIAGAAGQAEQAARLFGAADAISDTVGHRPRPGEDPHRERALSALRSRLDERTLVAAWNAGRALTQDEAIAAARTVVDAAAAADTTRRRDAAAAGMTPKEREVLCLIAAGLSNLEIADRLFVTRRTITTHVEHIFAKLGVRTRTEAAIQARDRGLC
jgi:non-specific serine/threonine protein kinase